MALLVIGLIVVACSRPPQLIGVDNANVPVDSVVEAKRHKIFLATTRRASESVGALYSSQRAPSLGLASVEVSIPPTHETGKLERPKRLPPDARTEFAVVAPSVYMTENAFIGSVNKALAEFPPGDRDILFYVHGYNNTTSDSVLRLAQFVEDAGFQGVAVLFDWASAARITRYVYDLNSALVARPQIEEIGQILSRTNADGFDIFAHSMGAFLTMEALVQQSHRGQLGSSGRLRGIILASPDIDVNLFQSQLRQIGTRPDQLFVLLSKDDGALKFSRRIAGGVPRVGAADANALAKLGVVAIDLSEVNDSNSGSHSKFAGSPEVVRLIGNGLNNHSQFSESGRSTLLGDMLQGVPINVVFE